MVVGMRALTWSCSFFEDDEEAEPGKFEAWLDKVFGEKLESALMTVVKMCIRDSLYPPDRNNPSTASDWSYPISI